MAGSKDYGLGLIRYGLTAWGIRVFLWCSVTKVHHNNISLYAPEMDAVIVLALNSNAAIRFPVELRGLTRPDWQFLAQMLSTMQRVGR